MATFYNFSLMVAFMISLTLMVKTGLSYNVLDPSNSLSGKPNHALGPVLSYEEYLHNCSSKLYPTCGDEIFAVIFFGNQTLTDGCCYQLVNEVGKLCHDDMTKYILKKHKFTANQHEILQSSGHVWNDCVNLASPLIVSISPVAPSIEPVGAES